MNEFEKNTAELLECPVCFRIPRILPLASCSFGHIGSHGE